MVNWTGHYSAIYSALGVPATFVSGSTYDHAALTVIDKISGVIAFQVGEVQTVRPACAVRATELASRGVAVTDLDGSYITVNAKEWRIESHIAKPSPTGEAQGEYYLLLIER